MAPRCGPEEPAATNLWDPLKTSGAHVFVLRTGVTREDPKPLGGPADPRPRARARQASPAHHGEGLAPHERPPQHVLPRGLGTKGPRVQDHAAHRSQ